MQNPQITTRLTGAILLGVAVLSGCSASPTVDEQFVGESLATVRSASTDRVLLIYDLSTPVLGIAASYNASSPDDLWVVVSACESDRRDEDAPLPVGIVSSDAYTAEISEKASSGDFNSLLLECSGEG